ncbi:DUF6083 domain-containing protein [Streptomyces sp. NPDC052236]|uniref:DUF6083 domain-containing protein n=1 Tax=Streptomyces sp. NPDC052236 TaxID=3365686 RepID=UPI0037CDDE05
MPTARGGSIRRSRPSWGRPHSDLLIIFGRDASSHEAPQRRRRPHPTHTVPAGQRWRVAPDCSAVKLGSASPTDTCRVSHFSVCPGRGA